MLVFMVGSQSCPVIDLEEMSPLAEACTLRKLWDRGLVSVCSSEGRR